MFYMLKTENFLGKYRLMQTTLGFVISNCKNLQHCLMFFCLYFSFLSSRVEYGCIILSPSYNSAAFLLPRRNARDPPCFYVELSRTNVYIFASSYHVEIITIIETHLTCSITMSIKSKTYAWNCSNL
jgi:hypothetical protein